jgi:hypothetical protein
MSDLNSVQSDDDDVVSQMTTEESERLTAILELLNRQEVSSESVMLAGIDPGEPEREFDSEEAAFAHASGLLASASILAESANRQPEGSKRSSLLASSNDHRYRAMSIRSAVAQSKCVRLLVRQVSNQHKLLAVAISKLSSTSSRTQPRDVPISSSSQVSHFACMMAP